MPKSRGRIKTKRQKKKAAIRKNEKWDAAYRARFPERFTSERLLDELKGQFR